MQHCVNLLCLNDSIIKKDTSQEKPIMTLKTVKKLFITLTAVLVVGILYILFQTDIIIISNQVATDLGVSQTPPTQVFTKSEGYVQYIEEQSIEELSFPLLSDIHGRLSIPRLGIEGAIVEGKDEKMLDLGFWHYPSASPFATKGNVVVIGHRFLKLPPHRDTFYHLDWVKIGDEIHIKSDNRNTVRYKVREKKVVSIHDDYVLQQTLNPQITLITCHPLWTSKERLVIIGDKIEETHNESETTN